MEALTADFETSRHVALSAVDEMNFQKKFQNISALDILG